MRTPITARNAILDSRTTLLNTGYLRIYSGPRPATPETALSGNTELVTLRFGATAFGAASGGSATANAIAQVNAIAPGTATFARAFRSDGTTLEEEYSVGTSGADINLITTTIVAGQPVSITSMTHSMPVGT